MAEIDYGLKRTTDATVEPLTPKDFRGTQIAESEEDPQILEWLKAARHLVEDWTGKQLISATWQMTLDAFPDWEIELPRGPILAITSVAYLDTDGTSQTLSSSGYRLDTVRGRLTPAYGESWPESRDVTNAVTITYTSGFGTAASDVPPGFKAAIRATVMDWFEHRRMVFELPSGVKQMLMSLWGGAL